MWTNSARYHSFPHSISPRLASRRNEEIESCRRWMLIESTFALTFFFIAFFFNRLSKCPSVFHFFFFFFLERRVFVPRENYFQPKRQTWFSPMCFTVSVSSSSRLVASKDNPIESVDRSISLVKDSERWTGNLVDFWRFGLMGHREEGYTF